MPCSTTSLSGAALETITYGYLLLQGAKLLSDGSEGLLEVLDNPGLIGGRQHSRLPAAQQAVSLHSSRKACSASGILVA